MEVLERIREMLGRIGDLTDAELTELRDLIFSAVDTYAEDVSAESTAALTELETAAQTVLGESTQREAARQQLEADHAGAVERLRALADPEADPPAAPADPDASADPEADDPEANADPEADPEVTPALPDASAADPASADPEGVPIAASAVTPPSNVRQLPAPRAHRMAALRGRAAPSPSAQGGEVVGRPAVVAASGLRDFNPGEVIPDRGALGYAMADVLGGLRKEDRPTGRHTIARARWDQAYPEERRLGRDAQINTERIDAVCAAGAVVASGGICLPVNVDYSVPTWAAADRPLRDALPSFQADRGGLTYVSPPDIGVPSLQAAASGLGEATGIWTEATDAAPDGATKPVYQVTCGEDQTVYVSAIPTRVGFGNMFGRFAPEQVAANTDLAVAVAAREAELNLLELMFNASKQVKPEQYLGATRDLLASADLLAAQYRYSHRIPRSVGLTAVFPDWAKDLIRADMARELAHDTNGRDPLAVTDAQIEEWFTLRGISIVWTLDGLKAGTYGTGGSAITDQFFGLLATDAPEPQWPGQTSDGAFQLAWLLFAEGSYQFLDGGRLDLGVVRDSTLDATNDYETFVETFEGLAFRGVEAYQVQSTILPDGGSGGTVASSSYHE